MLRDVSRVGSQSSDDTLSKSFSITIMGGYKYPDGPGYNYNTRGDDFFFTLTQIAPNNETAFTNQNDYYSTISTDIYYSRSSSQEIGTLRINFRLEWSRNGLSDDHQSEQSKYVFVFNDSDYNIVTGPGIYDRGYVLCKFNANTDIFKALFKDINTYFYNTHIKAIKLRSQMSWTHNYGDLSSFGYKYLDNFGYLLEDGRYIGIYHTPNNYNSLPYYIQPLSSGYNPSGINNYAYADIRCEALELLTKKKNFLVLNIIIHLLKYIN